MRVALYDPTATPPTMQLVERATRAPEAHEIRIDVRAAPVSEYWLNAETAPFVPTGVFAGYVAEVGSRVKRLSVGQRVVAMSRTGGLATSAVVPSLAAALLPDDLAFHDAICLTAGAKVSLVVEEVLERFPADHRQRSVAVVHDGTHFASLVAGLLRHRGVRVIGVSRSPSTVEHQRIIGFHDAIDTDDEPIEPGVARLTDGHGVGCVIDHLGAVSLDTALQVLGRNGWLIRCDPARTPLASAMPEVLRQFEELGASVVEFAGVTAAARNLGRLPELTNELTQLIIDGSIVLPTTMIAFDDVARVPELIRSRTVAGAIVVTR